MSASKLPLLRARAFRLQAGRCYYCSCSMWQDSPQEIGLPPRSKASRLFKCTAEHLVARCEGGTDKADNIVAACFLCNSRRHQFRHPLAPEAYRNHVANRLARGKWHQKFGGPTRAAPARLCAGR
jgi:hypothetical protein